MTVKDGVHVVIFCAHKYRNLLLDHCIYGIDQHVKDTIATKTIVTDVPFYRDDYDVITDHELWDRVDRDFVYRDLFSKKWIRQQVLKLSVDKIKTGTVLVVDADLFFLKPTLFIENNGFNIHTSTDRHYQPYFDGVKFLIGLSKQITQSFVTDFAIIDTKILQELIQHIEHRHKQPWLGVLSEFLDHYHLPKNYTTLPLSEYELYGTYLFVHHSGRINHLVSPANHSEKISVDLDSVKSSSKMFFDQLQHNNDNHYQSVLSLTDVSEQTQLFVEFYQNVRGLGWPDCEHESEFRYLPDMIQQECLDLHHIGSHIPYFQNYHIIDSRPLTKKTDL